MKTTDKTDIIIKENATDYTTLYDLTQTNNSDENNRCLHQTCPSCDGTGKNKLTGGMCIHFISCSCRKCSVWC